MIFSINETSAYALSILKTNQQGIVHSVYRRTINLSFNEALVALQSNGSPLSPISLITELSGEQMESLHVSPGDLVIVSKNKLTIISSSGHFAFKFTSSTVCDTKFSPILSYEDTLLLRTRIDTVLTAVNTNGFDLIFNNKITDSSPLPLIAAKDKIETGRTLFKQGKYEKAAKELIRLIGLGSGLTPSGDDFICGLLAGITILNMSEHPFSRMLKEKTLHHLSDTVDVSAAFLFCALQNQFSLAVNTLGNLPSCDDIAEHFLAIGHSSGIDTLCGISFALNALNI